MYMDNMFYLLSVIAKLSDSVEEEVTLKCKRGTVKSVY